MGLIVHRAARGETLFPVKSPNRSHCSLSVQPVTGSWLSQPANPGSVGAVGGPDAAPARAGFVGRSRAGGSETIGPPCSRASATRGATRTAHVGVATASAPATMRTPARASFRRGARLRLGRAYPTPRRAGEATRSVRAAAGFARNAAMASGTAHERRVRYRARGRGARGRWWSRRAREGFSGATASPDAPRLLLLPRRYAQRLATA